MTALSIRVTSLGASFWIPPPKKPLPVPTFPVTSTRVSVSGPVSTRMPAPWSPVTAPPVTVRSRTISSASLFRIVPRLLSRVGQDRRTVAPLPFSVRVRPVSLWSSTWQTTYVAPAWSSMVSCAPLVLAVSKAARSDPGPPSAVVVTVTVAAEEEQ